MRLSIHKWFYIKSIGFLIAILGPLHQTIAREYKHARTLIGVKGAIGGVALPGIKEYAKKHGYNQVTTPFCHLDLEGTLYVERRRRLLNYRSSRIELGYSYMHPSFTGEADQNKIKQSIGLHCHGGHFSCLFYLYPNGRFAANGSWSGHIGARLLFSTASKDIATRIETKKNDRFSIFSIGPVLGIEFEFISGLQLECRYCWLLESLEAPRTTDLHGVSLGIGYVFK